MNYECGIYQLKFPNGIYIGSSFRISKRIKNHQTKLIAGKHGNIHLQRSYEKYKEFESEVILVCRKEDLIFYEQICIDNLKPSLNLSRLAGKVEYTEEVRKKMSEAKKISRVGQKHSEETKMKISLSKIGKARTDMYGNTRMKGRKQSDAARAKMSTSHLNRKKSCA